MSLERLKTQQQESPSRQLKLSLLRDKILAVKQHYRNDALSLKLGAIEQVVIVATSSRGGSSYFMEMLRHRPELLQLTGEMTPFMRLANLTYPETGAQSDAFSSHTQQQAHWLDALLRGEISAGIESDWRAAQLEPIDRDQFANELHVRLMMQWPEEEFDGKLIRQDVNKVLDKYASGNKHKEIEIVFDKTFHLHFIAQLSLRHPKVNLYYYDIGADKISEHYPMLALPSGPPSGLVVEEPPFIAVLPKTKSSAASALGATKTLLVKAPSHAYHLNFLRSCFANARFRIIHLQRNPAAVINGLYDGWLHHGFFVQAMNTPLNIKGYSYAGKPWTTRWWNFDIPPQWENLADQPLEYVCGFQWLSAHSAIEQFLVNEKVHSFDLKFEQLMAPKARRRNVFNQLSSWLGMGSVEAEKMLELKLPPIMATCSPSAQRWKKRRSLIEPVINQVEIKDMAIRLGYAKDHNKWG